MAIGDHVRKYQESKTAAAAPAVEHPPTPTGTPLEAAPMTQADFLTAMQSLIAAIKASDDPAAKERALLEAERLGLERERLTREMPENKQSPGISVYSYPEGDLKRPKPELKCKFYWCGPEEHIETLTPEEIELRNRLEPGNYQVTKSDGARIPFVVEGKRSTDGRIEAMAVTYPCRDEHKHNHMPNTAYLRQVLGDAIPSSDELMAELTKLKAELASARTGVGA